MANSVDPEQTAPMGAACSWSTLFASILNSSVMLGNYLQQTTSSRRHFQMHFFSWRFKGLTYILVSSCVALIRTLAPLLLSENEDFLKKRNIPNMCLWLKSWPPFLSSTPEVI